MSKQVKIPATYSKYKHKKNGHVHSSCAYAYIYVIALTSENVVDISTSISTRPWTRYLILCAGENQALQDSYRAWVTCGIIDCSDSHLSSLSRSSNAKRWVLKDVYSII